MLSIIDKRLYTQLVATYIILLNILYIRDILLSVVYFLICLCVQRNNVSTTSRDKENIAYIAMLLKMTENSKYRYTLI